MTKKRCFSATVSLAMLVSIMSMPVFAQEEGAVYEEVVVTGSRIARDTFTTPAPVTVLDSSEIEAVGATNIGEFLARVPQTVTAINSSNNVFANSSSGLQTQALRNLGSARTLVLVNGKRFVSGQTPSTGYAVDLNAIPVAMVERIEIKTGGTSAIYGSDAIAGVINFILKDDFEGVEMRAQTNQPQDGGRTRYDIDLTLGSNFEKGNAWASVGYSEDNGMSALDRDFSDTDLAYYNQSSLDALGLDKTSGNHWLGSSFPPGGRFGSYQGDGTPFRSGLADRENSDRFNRASFRDLSSPTERRYAAAGVKYEIAERTTAHLLINYNQSEIQTTYEPFPLDLVSDIWDIPKGGTGGLDVATSPLLPDLLRTNLLADGITNLNQLNANTTSRRLTEFDGRGASIDRQTFRIEGGVTYDFDNGMIGEIWGTWGQTRADQQNNSGINAERAAFALDTEIGPDGEIRCVDEEARRRGCAPFNVFGENTVSQAAVDYLGLNTQTDQQVEQKIVGATLSGDASFIPELPGGLIGFATGLEYRKESGAETPDAAVQSGVTTSNKILATSGSWDVTEIFLEVSVPVLERLSLDGAVRYGDYSTVGGQTNWMLGFDAPVTDWMRFRGNYSSAVRAPNVSDLFRGAGETFASVQDVCNGTTNATPGNVGTNCRSVPAIQQRIDDTGAFTLSQVETQSTGGFNGGNPEAQEETADTYGLGVIFTPGDSFRIAIDYYDIKLKDVLTLPLRSDVVTNCYSVAPGQFDANCPGPVPNGQQTVRDPNRGGLIEVNRSFLNQEDWDTNGIDVEANYATDLGPGQFSVNVLWTYLLKFEITDLNTGAVNVEDGEVEYPEHRVYAGLNYTMDRWAFNWTISYMDKTLDSNTPELTNENSDTFGSPLDSKGNTCKARSYHDISASFDASNNINLFAGVRNLFDQDPCELTQISKYGNTGLNTNGAMFDLTGRDFYLGIRARL